MNRNSPHIIAGGNFTVEPIKNFLPVINEIIEKKISINTIPSDNAIQLLIENPNHFSESDVVALFLKMDIFFYNKSKNQALETIKIIENTIKIFSEKYQGNIFVFICPSSDEVNQNKAEKTLLNLEKTHGVTIFHYREILKLYPLDTLLSPHTENESQIPYQAEFYKILCTYLSRMYMALRNPHKVIAVDCDNTLWEGVCGEDNISKITINPAQKALQEILQKKSKEGFIICLCSNNNEEDVLNVFKYHKKMTLKLENIAAYKINWEPKYKKLIDLSNELNLDLNSFLLIDDNPIDIEGVSKNVNEVTTINWKNEIHIVKNIWAFDTLRDTTEDKKRLDSYKSEKSRKELKRKIGLKEDYLTSLNIKIKIKLANNFERLSQLSYRVNQFRFSQLRTTANYLKKLSKENFNKIYEISVKDKFGDYGIIGFLYISFNKQQLDVKEFCLSCRALGRNIELRTMKFLQKIAQKYSVEKICIKSLIGEKNIPAISFLENLSPIIIKKTKKNEMTAFIKSNSLLFLKENKKITRNQSIQEYEKNKINYGKIATYPWNFSNVSRIQFKKEQSIKEKLIILWENSIKRDYKIEYPFISQASSLELVFFSGKIYEALDFEFPLSKLFEFNNIEKLADYLENKKNKPKENKGFSGSNSSYQPIFSQSLLKTSSKIYSDDLYNVSHVCEVTNLSSINELKKRLWNIIKSIPELRATLTENQIVCIKDIEEIDKDHFIQMVKCDRLQTKILWEDIKRRKLDTFFYIFSHGKNCVTLLFSINHFFFDRYSIENFILKKLFSDEVIKLDSLAKYSWTENNLVKTAGNKNEKFFCKQCKNASPFEMPTRKNRKNNYLCETIKKEVPKNIYEKLKNNHIKFNASLFEISFSAFINTLSYYYNSKEPFIVGTAFSTRDILPSEAQSLFGPLFNLVPISVKPRANQSIKALIKKTTQLLRSAEKHKIFNLQNLIKHLGLKRFSGRHPLFPVLFIWHESTPPFSSDNKNTIKNYSFSFRKTEFDLICYITDHGNSMNIRIDYAKELFLPNTMNCFLEILLSTFKYISNTPENKPINHNEIIPYEALPRYYPDKNYILEEKSIFEEIQNNILKYPDKKAICTNSFSMTYHDLARKINEYTQFIESTFKQANIIALNFSNRLRYIVSIISLLKLGKGFIPLTNEQINYITSIDNNVGKSIPILTDNRYSKNKNINFVVLPEKFNLYGNELPNINNLSNIAYRIYTSGSTGKPKSVEVTHRSLLNVINDFKKRLNLNNNMFILAHTSYSFDISLLEMLLPLVTGATCVLKENEAEKDIHSLINLINHFPCHLIQATPSIWRTLLSAGWKNETNARLLCGGEKLTANLAHDLKEITPELWNLYGPTETTIWSLAHLVENPNEVNLGQPISNTYCYVINQGGFPAAPGSYGELYIGGLGVANGYLNSDEKNKESFFSDPINNTKIYRTGDFVWINPYNKSLIFAGRKDRQIKRYGRRIDATEIESALLNLKPIKQVAVITELNDHDVIIHAFMKSQNKNIKTIKLLSEKLLPYYLVPNYFHIENNLPITNNGKIDLGQLKNLLNKNKTKQIFTEKKLEIVDWLINWCKHEFNLKIISSNDNFFNIGGNSLIAVKLANDLSNKTGHIVKAMDIFKYPSLQALADAIHPLNMQNRNFIKIEQTQIPNYKNEKIAIIGIGIKLPNINTTNDFWTLIKNKKSTIKHYSLDVLKKLGISNKTLSSHNFIPAFSHSDNLFEFDADFFNFSPKEALQTDPQHRMLLTLSWSALKDANITLNATNNNIGIYASCHNNHYLDQCLSKTLNILPRERLSLEMNSDQIFLATRIAYKLALSGPAISINTACSSGLVCVAEACKALLAGEAEVMLAAAASITLPHQIGYHYEAGHIFSKTGQCKPFTKNADGTVPGSGAGAIVLKPLSKALEDGNPVYAVIEGFATNNDAKRKANYTSPSSEAHAQCISKALHTSKINKNHIAYIETHGTGTAIGDPIELEALKQAYYNASTIHLGALKANIGHTNTAAGLIGLIKLCLARHQDIIPGNIYTNTPISNLNKPHSQFKLTKKSIKWPDNKLYGGISSLGVGGTNCHIIIGPAPQNAKVHHKVDLQSIETPLKTKVYKISENNECIEQPTEKIESTLLSFIQFIDEIFKDILGYEHISIEQSFYDIGGDSLSTLELIAHIEKKFDVSLTADEIQSNPSIKAIAGLLQKKQVDTPNISLVKLNQTDKKPSLILIHPGNGNIYHYRILAQLLSNVFEVFAINYPTEKEIFTSIEQMAEHYIKLINVKFKKPYYLGGWSYGASVAQEIAFRIKNSHYSLLPPKYLILIDGWAKYSKNLLEKELFFDAYFNKNLPDERDSLWMEAFWKKMYKRMKILVSHTPKKINQKTLLIKAGTYPNLYVEKNLSDNGWGEYITHEFDSCIVPGEHNNMLEYPYINKIADIFINLIHRKQ